MATAKKKASKKAPRRSAAARKNASAAKPAESATGRNIPLKRICGELGIEPKAARVKLRRLARNGTLSFRDEGPVGEPGTHYNLRWEFTPAQAEKVKAAFIGEGK